jgi:hypothetical protein
MAQSPKYHAVLANIRWLEHTLNREDGEETFRKTLGYLKRLAKEYGKATVMVMGEPEAEQEDRWRTVRAARSELCDSGVAIFPDIERATRTLGTYVHYLAGRRRA